MTTPEEHLAPIRDRAEAATEGPWVTRDHAMPGATVEEWFVREIVHPNGDFHPINVLKVRGASNASRECCWPPTKSDAAFIAHARTDVPRMLAALDGVLALAEEWRYKGEFGWGPWQEGYGPDPEGAVLDEAAARLRAAITQALEGQA